MTKIILIRHGETEWNARQIFRGRIDIPLNEVGLAQARAVKKWLKDEKMDVLYTSPLSRALETAKIVGEGRNCKINLEEGLVDINFGTWQGLSRREVEERYSEMYMRWQTLPHTITFPAGESLEDVFKRATGTLETIVKKHPQETVVLVSHRVVCKVLLCAIMEIPLSRFWYIKQDTCAINIFKYEKGHYYLTLFNDTCHLKNVEGASLVDF